MRSSSTLTSITGRRGRSARISIPKAQAQARMPSVLQTASSQPRRQSVFASPRAAQGKASSPFYSEVPSDSHGAARPSPAASRSRHKALLSETSKPVRRRRVDKTNSVPDDEDSILDTSAVAADRGHCTRALRRYAGPASTRGARRPCGAADGARGASHGYPSEFKVRRGRSCGCSIMRSDGINTENYSDKKHMQ